MSRRARLPRLRSLARRMTSACVLPLAHAASTAARNLTRSFDVPMPHALYTMQLHGRNALRTPNLASAYPPTVRDRGKAFEPPPWWLQIARERVRAAGGYAEMGRRLARLAGRPTPWSSAVLSRFAAGLEMPTQELALALSRHLEIPRPMMIPPSLESARLMEQIMLIAQPAPGVDTRAHAPTTADDEPRQTSPAQSPDEQAEHVRAHRLAVHDDQLAALWREVEDQTGAVSSDDGRDVPAGVDGGGAGRRRRRRGTLRGG